MKIIIINGAPQTGKDEIVKITRELFTIVYNLSTVDMVKSAAYDLGWDGKKTPRSRKFLSYLKDLSTKYSDFIFDEIVNRVVRLPHGAIVFIHSREPDEVMKFREKLGATTLLIRRSIENTSYCHSDQRTEEIEYDYLINNNGSLDDLSAKVSLFIKSLS